MPTLNKLSAEALPGSWAEGKYAISRFLEEGEYRTAFQANLTAAGLDRRTARTALRTYDQLTQGGAGGKRTAMQLQGEILRAAAQKAEIMPILR